VCSSDLGAIGSGAEELAVDGDPTGLSESGGGPEERARERDETSHEGTASRAGGYLLRGFLRVSRNLDPCAWGVNSPASIACVACGPHLAWRAELRPVIDDPHDFQAVVPMDSGRARGLRVGFLPGARRQPADP